MCQAGKNGDLAYLRSVDFGAVDINSKDEDGCTALLYASREGHESVVAYLIQQGADLNAADSDGYTPLMTASCEGHAGIVDQLLSAGADPTLKEGTYNETALKAKKFELQTIFPSRRSGNCGKAE